jgi:hypothetical protein
MFGSDFSGVESIDYNMTFLETEAEQRLAKVQAFSRRFEQGRGTLFYDGTYGLDLRMFVADVVPVPVAKGMIASEGLKEDGIVEVAVEIDIQEDGSWVIQMTPKLEDQTTFERVFTVTKDKVSLLEPGNALI